ncbi:MAG: prepilin-type N-terminal cleavage/methylation domain-containing protein, partial [Clostridiales bacterium]|nr:prepilin-type N-terminal cleavage/methylation domain-containing protein [Clostridiales bacterium]
MDSSKRALLVKYKIFQDNYYGFTLVELMITVAILAILAAVAIPAYSNYVNRAKQSDAIIGLKAAQMAQEQFFSENNAYANTIDILPGFNDGTVNNAYVKGEYT